MPPRRAAAPSGHPLRRRGFTLVECLVVCAVSAIVATAALPTLREPLRKTARLDAVALLTRVQAAQESHRSVHGRYSDDPRVLGVPGRSDQGLYRLTLVVTDRDTYRATATAEGPQADDRRCPALTLAVTRGYRDAVDGCWPR